MKIRQGVLKRNNKTYEARLLNVTDLNKIMSLQTTVYNQLSDKTKLERLSEEEFTFILSNNGLMIGIYVDNQLISVRALLVPKNDPDHLGLAIGLSEADLDKVIYQEISFVDSNYQGNGLQKIMAEIIMEELNKQEHSFTYVCATVAPDNIPSLKDKFSQGMQIRAFVKIYGEKQRYVFAKNLREDKLEMKGNKEIHVKLSNVNEVKTYLDSNWIGISLNQENDNYFIKLVQY